MNVSQSIEPVFIYNDGIGKVEYVDHMGTDLTIVNSARVSFGKHKSLLDKRDERLIGYLARHKHTSTFEHNVVTFRFTVPLFVRGQHHRHRTWSYNEISRRYTDIDIKFYEPKEFRTQHETNRQASNSDELINPSIIGPSYLASEAVRNHHSESLSLFNKLLESGVCREQARGVLPQNMYTEYYGTVNLNNLLKFIALRMGDGAQMEIQVVAKACLDIAERLWPIAVGSFSANYE